MFCSSFVRSKSLLYFVLGFGLQKLSQDKNEIDKITLTQDVELPDQGFTDECRQLLEGLLRRDVSVGVVNNKLRENFCFF